MVNVADYSHANLGKVEIVPEVISVIASIAVSEVEGVTGHFYELKKSNICLLYTSPSPRDKRQSRMPSSA